MNPSQEILLLVESNIDKLLDQLVKVLGVEIVARDGSVVDIKTTSDDMQHMLDLNLRKKGATRLKKLFNKGQVWKYRYIFKD